MTYQSFDFSTISDAQVLALFQQYLKESHSGLDRLLSNGANRDKGTNNKYEWLGSQLSPLTRAVNASSLAGAFNTAATMTFVSTTGLKANMILRFTASTGLDAGNMQVKVNSVDSATTATVVLYGGTTGVALGNTHTAKLLNEAVKENEKLFTGDSERVPAREYNHFQILRTSIELSRTAIASLVYGNVNNVSEQMKNGMYKMRQQMQEGVIRGRRVARDSGENGTFWGLLQYLNLAGTNTVSASSTALDPDVINELTQKIFDDGWSVNTIICSVNQARKISAFNRSGATGVNAYTMINEASKDAWNFALRFISDIPVANGIVSNIMIDDKMPIDQVALVDIDKMALVPYVDGWLHLENGTLPGQDGQTAILRGEYTLGFKDYKYAAGLITDLTT